MIQFTSEAIIVFGFAIRYYGILIALGALAGIYLMDAREAKYGLKKDTAIGACLWAMPAGLICARAYYVLLSWDAYKHDLMGILRFREGGMAIYGGVIGGVIAGYIYARKKRAPFLTLADLAAPGLALGQALGRWGNFINQEAYGAQITDARWQFFPVAVYIRERGGYFAATFFYESAWCFIICALILLIEKRRAFRFPGAAAAFYACMYAAERTVVESLRTDSLYLGYVRASQALSAVALTCTALMLARMVRNKRARLGLYALSIIFGGALIACAFVPGAPFALLIACAACVLAACLICFKLLAAADAAP